jgi:hypothetical protein
MSRDLVQLWSAPQCQTGAVAVGPITTWQSARVSLSEGAPPGLTMSGVLRAELTAADAREGCALRVLSPTRGVSWWVVAQITDTAEQDVAALRCVPLRSLLALRGLVRVGSLYSFTPPTDVSLLWLVREYVLSTSEIAGARPELAEDGLDWLELRTVEEPAAPIVLPPFAGQTRGQVLATLEQLSQRTAVLVPKDALGATGFWLDLLRDPSAAENRWPIREDGQLVGAFVRLAIGDTREITESRASDSSVRIASITGLSVNDRVGLVLDADSTPVDEVVSPSRLARVGRVVATQSASAPTLARQWARDPDRKSTRLNSSHDRVPR